MFQYTKITEIYCKIDYFVKDFNKTIEKSILGNKPKRKPTISDSEIMIILREISSPVIKYSPYV